MPLEKPGITPEKWSRVQCLFDEMMDSADPEGVLASEPDREIAAWAERIWHDHQAATAGGFLDETITLIRKLSAEETPRFQDGELLAGRFLVVQLLGAGGMGEVYLAHDQRLNERVAIKTIRAHLATYPAIRERFIAEVQNARRVTHTHVCRIFELFDEREIPCFSMEYLEGISLADWLIAGEPSPALKRRIALELAEGLSAAHRSGVIHGDFKPGNVILTGDLRAPRTVITDFGLARAFSLTKPVEDNSGSRPEHHSRPAGTREYMAPELLNGKSATVQSDIYAYGKVLAQLIPPERLIARCLAERPQERPALDTLIRRLRGDPTRRNLLLAAGLPATALASYALFRRRPVLLAGRERIALNAFQPAGAAHSATVRELLMTALQQSPLLAVVADDHLRYLLDAARKHATSPVSRAELCEAAVRERIPLVLEGEVEESANLLRIQLHVIESQSTGSLLSIEEQVSDPRHVVKLADRAALHLRSALGESAGSLQARYTPLEQVTSASPEAVDCYFRGVREYESSHAREALGWFDQAIGIDPQFALAHMRRGLALAASFQVPAAIDSYTRAFELRSRVSERERLWIESRYYNLVGDYVSARERCRMLTVLYPEDSIFQRQMGLACVRMGRPEDALPFNRRAVDLDPSNENNLSELVANTAEANQADEALALHRLLRQQGHINLLNWGSGLAYMVKGEYEKAQADFEEMAHSPERERWSRLLRCGPLVLQGRFADASSALAADLAYDLATDEVTRRQTRRSWLGLVDWLMDSSERAYLQAAELVRLDASPAYIQPLREGALLSLKIGHPELTGPALVSLTEIERRWPSTHTRGARAHLQGAALLGHDDEQAGSLLLAASGLRPDPLTLISLAEWQGRRNEHAAQLATLELLEQQRPSILRHYFPGLVVLCWIERARCLTKLSRFSESLRLYEQILRHWLQHAGSYKVVRQVQAEYGRLRLNLT